MKGYRLFGTFGALVGANLAVMMLKIPVENDFLFGNHIGESIMFLGLLGFIFELIPSLKKSGLVKLGIYAFFFGLVWEALSFLTGFSRLGFITIIKSWFAFGLPTIFLLGIPVIILSDHIREEKKIFGIKVTNMHGLVFCFVSALILGAVILSVIYNLGIYHLFARIVNYNATI